MKSERKREMPQIFHCWCFELRKDFFFRLEPSGYYEKWLRKAPMTRVIQLWIIFLCSFSVAAVRRLLIPTTYMHMAMLVVYSVNARKAPISSSSLEFNWSITRSLLFSVWKRKRHTENKFPLHRLMPTQRLQQTTTDWSWVNLLFMAVVRARLHFFRWFSLVECKTR